MDTLIFLVNSLRWTVFSTAGTTQWALGSDLSAPPEATTPGLRPENNFLPLIFFSKNNETFLTTFFFFCKCQSSSETKNSFLFYSPPFSATTVKNITEPCLGDWMLVKQTTPCSHVNWAFSELNSWTRKEGQVLPQCTPCHKYCCYLAQSQGDRANNTTNALKQQANVAGLVPNLSSLSNEQAVTLCSPEILLIPFPEGSILTHLLSISCPWFRFSINLKWDHPVLILKCHIIAENPPDHVREAIVQLLIITVTILWVTQTRRRGLHGLKVPLLKLLQLSQIQRPGMFWNARLNHWDLSEARTSSSKQASISAVCINYSKRFKKK